MTGMAARFGRGLVGLLFALHLTARLSGDVVITEFVADNQSGLLDEDGAASDWIEIYNNGNATVNLAGWRLTDDAGDLSKWIFPSTNLQANEFMVVFASAKNRRVAGAPLHTSFSLSASGEYLALVRPDGTVATEFAPAFPEQFEDVSFGFAQGLNITPLVASNAPARVLVPTDGLLGTSWTARNFNDALWRAGTNGVGFEAGVPGFVVKVFKANGLVQSLADAENVIANPALRVATYAENRRVVNFVGTGGGANYGEDSPFPGLPSGIDIDDFVMEATGTLTIPAPGDYSFGVSSDDGFRLTIGGIYTSACDCLRGPGDTVATFNFAVAGDYPIRLVFFERSGGAEVELFAAPGLWPVWQPISFDLVGDTGNGGLAVRSQPVAGGKSYRGLITTDIEAEMLNRSSSAYIRIPFTLAAVTNQTLTLRMKYDDGFVAYLNGTQVARRNVPALPAFNSTALGSRTNAQAIVYEDIVINSAIGLLLPGTNVLAIHALNVAASDGDLLLVAELAEIKATQSNESYFSTPTPGSFNDSAAIRFVADTKFSHSRGFYDTNFSLSITCATPGVTIYYTTNGTLPGPTNGFVYSSLLPIGGTRTVRAAAYRSGYKPSNVDTHTYIFVNDVVTQSADKTPPPGWPSSWGANVVDYGMDSRVVNDPVFGPEIRDDLKDIPTFSVVLNLADLFDSTRGIYANPQGSGSAWERPCSLELIYADGTKGFHTDCGIRLRGGFSRSTDNPKHAFRFFFREEYGAKKLKYDLFEKQDGAEEFDTFDLRTFQNYSWSFGGDPSGFFMRDVLSRDAQVLMGHQGERGDYYHLYINGVYWGLYNTCERPEASFAATYFGGSSDDYDVVKVDPQSGYIVVATDGDLNAWQRCWQAAANGVSLDADYFKIQGRNPDGTVNPTYENLLDVPNVIDYMLVILYGGNLDAPISAFLNNLSPNNWYGSRSRMNTGGYRFFAHDSEHTILNVNEDRTGPYQAGDPVLGGGFPKSNPQYVWQQLAQNAEFRMLAADHIQRHFFNGGVFTVEAMQQRFMQRSNELYRAVVCESARWGDSKRPSAPLTRTDWLNAVRNAWDNYIPQRTAIVLNQLRTDGLYPVLAAPLFSQFGGNVPYGYSLTITNTNGVGTIYYTLDGSDPRLQGGLVNPLAQTYSGPIVINSSRTVRARIRDGVTWSALVEATFYPLQDFTGLRVTEIMYNPPGAGATSGDEFEFLEFKNVGTNALDLGGANFTAGITFTFTNGSSLAPGQFFVLGRNRTQLANRYPGLTVHGVYTGRLDNGGETLTLKSVLAATILSVTYDDIAPWPIAPDGEGFSLVARTADAPGDPNDATYWRGSSARFGSPSADDPTPSLASIVINEILTHTDPPALDSIELHNPTTNAANISGWFLTDDAGSPRKFRIPNSTSIPAHGFVVFTETNFNTSPGSSNSFSLGSAGDQVYVVSGDGTNLTGYSHGFAFGAAANGVTFGRYSNSVGEELFPAQISNTLGGSNSGPRVGPVVISEVQYHPDPSFDEFIELQNITDNPVPLFDPAFPTNTWKVTGLSFVFPTNITIPANGFVILAGIDAGVFRAKYDVPANVLVLGPFAGVLQDSGERLELKRPDAPDTNGVPYILVDDVRYNDKLPWPVIADGGGPSLQRFIATAYGNDPTNWFASGMSPGRANVFNAAPNVALTAPEADTSYRPREAIQISALAGDPDGMVQKVEFYANGVKVGESASAPYAATWTNAPPGVYSLTARATDNGLAIGVSAPVRITVLAPVLTNVITRGSTWKYLDNGTDQGTAWRANGFDDSTWASGRAQFGYGDGDEVTTNSYGADPNNKYITTYYRMPVVITNAARFLGLTVSVLRDDGAVVYLNGTEVFRSNLPMGPIGYRTLASSAVSGGDETSTFFPGEVDATLLVNGTNIIAVEIHQSGAASTDISFDLELRGSLVPPLPRIEITNPTNNARLAEFTNVTLNAVASDIDGNITNVEFYASGVLVGRAASAPYTTTWTNVLHGRYRLTAVARIQGSVNKTSAPVNVTVIARDTDGDGMPDYWEDQFTLNRNSPSDATIDSDGDGASNRDEFIAGTHPRNAASVLRLNVVESNPLRLRFTAASNVSYAVQFTMQLPSAWTSMTNIPVAPTQRTVDIVDPNNGGASHRLYRVRATAEF